jgi:hypothetical protein
LAEKLSEAELAELTSSATWSPQDCFEKAAELLSKMDDETERLRMGYEARDLAGEWRRLGVAIRGDKPTMPEQ